MGLLTDMQVLVGVGPVEGSMQSLSTWLLVACFAVGHVPVREVFPWSS